MSEFKDYDILIEKLRKKISNLDIKVQGKSYGIVLKVADGIATVIGLDEVTIGEVVNFLEDGSGMVMRINQDSVDIMLFNKIDEVKAGTEIFTTHDQFQVNVGYELLGRVINVMGEPIDGNGIISTAQKRAASSNAPGIMQRTSVCEPLQTGIKIIDSLIPIGLGQKQLILGDRQTGKTTLAIDTILNQKKIKDANGKFVYCIYVAVGKRMAQVREIYEILKERGALEYTIIVAATASDAAAQIYMAPMVGTAIAEFFRDKGEHALVIFDDLTKHADAYREISLLMRRVPARGAYPGDIFYLHSKLLERAVKLRQDLGAGSVTMLPIIETQAGDVSDYVPTNIISITDGQIYLDKQIFFEGQKPAINIGLSVSRIGSAAQLKNMKNIAASLKGELAQFKEYESFSKSVSDLDINTRRIIERGRLLMQIFNQRAMCPVSMEKMFIILFAGVRGLISKCNDIDYEFENQLFDFIFNSEPEIISAIGENSYLNSKMQERLVSLIKEFVEQKKHV